MAERPPLAPIERAPRPAQLLGRGLTRRCAWCGDGRAYFRGWFGRQEWCRRCGHGYRRGDHAFEIGAFTINMVVTLALLLLALSIAGLASGADLAWMVGAAAGVAVLAPAVFYPMSYSLWQAIDLWVRPPTTAELAGEGEATL